MRCCGHDGQVIDLRSGAEPLRMVRCTSCGRREWQLAGQTIEVDTAFEALAQTYRAVPRAARAVRDRVATQTAARAAVRAARAGTTTACPAADEARPVDRSDLASLLQGWAVLGQTA